MQKNEKHEKTKRIVWMNIGYLEEYLELVSSLNYTAAARRLNITQSALSKHIAALEKEFGATFIDRSKQQIKLTQQGRIFCEEASKIVDAYQSAYHRLHKVKQEIRMAGSLRDSAVSSIQALAQDTLRDAGTPVSVTSLSLPFATMLDALTEGEVDLIIDIITDASETGMYSYTGLETHFLTSVPLLAVAEQNHKLATQQSITIEELSAQRIMHPTGSMHIQRGSSVIEGIFARHGVKLRKRIFYADSWNDFPTVDLGEDFFIMPRSLFNKQLFGAKLFESLCGIPIADDDARFPYGITQRTAEKDPAILRYVQALLDAAQAIDAAH